MSSPGEHDLYHIAGDTLEQGFRVNYMDANTLQSAGPADLTGWLPSAQAWNARTALPVAGLSASLANQAVDPGVVTLTATAEATATWTAGPSLVYQLQLTEVATGFVRTVLAGRIIVERG